MEVKWDKITTGQVYIATHPSGSVHREQDETSSSRHELCRNNHRQRYHPVFKLPSSRYTKTNNWTETWINSYQ